MRPLKSLSAVEIEVLSPLHIGTGRALQRGYDYTVFRDQMWRINEDPLFADKYIQAGENQQALNRVLMGRPAEELLEPSDYRLHPEYFRYHMPGQPRAEGQGAELRECLKDPYDRPYIPGSTLKGALRTVVAWTIFREEKRRFSARALGSSRSWAGQPLERELLGRDPNHDLLRAVIVHDSAPAKQSDLLLANVQVVAGRRAQAPIEVEAIKMGTQLQTSLTLDEYLLEPNLARRLGWGQKGDILRSLSVHSRNLALVRIKAQQAYFAGRPEFGRVQRFYQLLEKLHAQLKDTPDFLLQIGWGGGWDAKTLGDQLTAQPKELEEIIDRYRMNRGKARRTGDTFPRSRRLYFQDGRPTLPMGWVLVRMRAEAA